jgi:hypothetical protein
MAVDPDDEALRWAGEEDAREVREVGAEQGKPQVSSLVLISYGVIAGAYLIYTLGWVIGIQRFVATHQASTDPLTAIMAGVFEFLAIASPIIWFGAVLALTRGAKPIIRLLWLLLGLIAVIPWPFVLGAWANGR